VIGDDSLSRHATPFHDKPEGDGVARSKTRSPAGLSLNENIFYMII
jgi:hypothetical protein